MPAADDRNSPPAASALRIERLREPVAVYRDRWSIPHIRARSQHDAFFAQGFVHAQDRLWQMDASRLRMQGRWAEWAGPSAIEGDALARRLDIVGASQRDYAALSPSGRSMLDAYSDGVNALLRQKAPLPTEYALLGDRPDAWEPWHSIAVMRHRGFLMGSVWFKLWRAAALRAIGPDAIAKLRYDDGGGDLLTIPPGADAHRWIADLQSLAPAIEAVARLSGADATGGGSNNWALAPARTASGRPLLAGDPHRAFEMPGMYLQTHIACEDFDAIGFSVPGVPGLPHFAHNGKVAWCVTHAFADIHDLFVERFDEGGHRYAFRDGWQQAQRRSERISVRGQAPVDIEIVTTHHGPVIAGDPAGGCALTLRSMQFAEPDASFDCLLPMLRSDTVEQLFDSTRGWGLIDHHLVAADTSGRIGHLVRAIVPRRSRLNGWLPVPGWTGVHEWDGMIPFERMPRCIDPPRGFIVTANNRITFEPGPDDDYLCTDCHPPYRARRIESLLAGLARATMQDMAAIHRDDLSATAPLFRDRVRALTRFDEGPAGAAQASLRDLIAGWDCRMAPDSVAAAAYGALRWKLAALLAQRSGLDRVAADPLAQVPPGVVPVNQLWWALPAFVRDDDVSLLRGWTWEQAFAEALRHTATAFDGKPWSQVHRCLPAHPLAPLLPAQAARLNSTGAGVGGDNDTVWANGCYSGTGLAASYGAVARYAFDVGDWDNSRWIVFNGVSGDPESAHYADQHDAWARCEMIPMRYGWDGIAADALRTDWLPAG